MMPDKRSATSRNVFAALWLVLSPLFLLCPVGSASAQTCLDVCGPQCVKPWAIPDRWDDETPIPGYTGDGPRGAANWVNNGQLDHEPFSDANGNDLYDSGESYVDGNGNGKYDEEQYDPALTGYIAGPYPANKLASNGDVGLEITIKPGTADRAAPGSYLAIDLPPVNRGTPISGADEYRNNMEVCNPAEVFRGDWLQLEPSALVGPSNQGMRELIAQDPDAYWDPITQSVQGSRYRVSPRIALIPLYDPRLPYINLRSIQVSKVAAFFMERMEGNASVRGRLTRTRGPGAICEAGAPPGGSFISFCPLVVAVDIRPGTCPNPLNPRGRGVLRVAILGTQGFDVRQIDRSSIRLAGVAPLTFALEDVATPYQPFTGKQNAADCNSGGPDGHMDLALKFDNQALAASLGPVTKGEVRVLKLTCRVWTGLPAPEVFDGEDVVTIVGRPSGSSGSGSGSGTDQAGDDSLATDASSELALGLNVPNPYRQHMALAYTVPGSGWVRLAVYDLRGHRLVTLLDRRCEPGSFGAAWDGKDERGAEVPQGVYFVRLQQDNSVTTGKIVLAR